MVITENKPYFNRLGPQSGGARVAVTASTGANNRPVAANLSIALAKRGKHVCLITTDNPFSSNAALTDQSWESPLEDLLNGKKLLAEILSDGSAGIQLLPVGNAFTNFFRMDGAKQKLLIELLAQLEAAFDYLIVETAAMADNGPLSIYQAAPLVLLSITPEADSLTSAFSLLRALRRQDEIPAVHIIVDLAASLPSAHDTFKNLSHAASKYLQIELQYLGYLTAQQPLQRLAKKDQAATNLYADSATDRYLNAIAERFCAIEEEMAPSTRLSRYFGEFCTNQKTAAERSRSAPISAAEPAERGYEETASNSHEPGQGQEWVSGRADLFAAIHYAGILAEREANQEGAL